MIYTVTFFDEPGSGCIPETIAVDTQEIAKRLNDDPTNDSANYNDLAACLKIIEQLEAKLRSGAAR